MDLTRQDIENLAAEYGIADQVEIHERLRPPEVDRLLNRVKVNLLWSRREGFNRAVIEGFFAGPPGIMREGFNYGYQYPYINAQTGAYATENNLPQRLLDMVTHHERYSPRAWVQANMNAQVATRLLDESICTYSQLAGQPWTPGKLVVKVTSLNSMAYWDETQRTSFVDDHAFVLSKLRARD